MKLWHLVSKEIRFRKAGFAIGLISIMAAIASLVGAVTLLRSHDLHTQQILVERERETREEMARLERDYRRIMREMGYNVMVLHEDQSIATLRSRGYPEKLMPQDYVEQLADGYIETLNHLLPVLQQRTHWPEREMDIILSGTPGQVPVRHKSQFLTPDGTAYRNPIMQTIPPGGIDVGSGIARELMLSPGDTVTLMGETFTVHRINPPQGNHDDITVWCNLDVAQRLLDQPGRINAIFALECVCAPDDLGLITQEVRSILPDTQVLEFSSRVVARAEARGRAEEAHRIAIAAEMEHRAAIGSQQRAFAIVLVPLIMVASGLWVFFLVLGNVREREAEIGILRALGVREAKIAGVFLVKAALMGVLGAVGGYVIGVIIGGVWGGTPLASAEFVQLFSPMLLLIALVIAVVLSAVAAWVPAMKAAQQDPAVVLRED